MTNISGGCSCGKIRFSADADPAFVAVCHCKACQKASGSAFAVVIALPATALKVTGDMPEVTGDRLLGTGRGSVSGFSL